MTRAFRLALPFILGCCLSSASADDSAAIDLKTFGLDTQQACISSSSFYNETLCRQQDRRFRTFSCSNIPPGPVFSCEEQVDLEKCFRSWMYKEAFCLRSCGRCGDGCVDIPPPGGSGRCDASLCESKEYIGTGLIGSGRNTSGTEPTMPYCLKTCRRCSVTTTT